MTGVSRTATRNSLKGWLLSDQPASRTQAGIGRAYRIWRALMRNPLGVMGVVIVGTLVLLAVFANVIAPDSPISGGDLRTERLLPPGAEHLFGTDDQARDIFSRLVYGSRVTLFIIVLVCVIATPIGLIVGMVAGFMGGFVDKLMMRLTDIVLAFPRLILALAFVAALGPGLVNAIIAIAITAWPPYARIARAETMVIRNSDFIAAAKLQGASTPYILWHHVAPLCTSSIIIRVTLDMAGIILTAAGLGFIGLGAQPPAPEWGAMVAAGRNYLIDQWWVAAVPGLAILVVSLGFNLLGDALRDVLDPKSMK